MKGTLAGVSKRRELGVDGDTADNKTNKPVSDAVTDKAGRLRRLSTLSSKRQSISAPRESQIAGVIAPSAAAKGNVPTRVGNTHSPPFSMQKGESGLGFLSRAPTMREQPSFKWGRGQ